MKAHDLPLPVEHTRAPLVFPLSTLLLFGALALVVGFFAGAIAAGEATLRLHEAPVEIEGGRP